MSQTLVQRPTPVHDLSSREIINVDDFIPNSGQVGHGDDDVQLLSYRPGRRSHEPIVIDDSDDDVQIVAGPSRTPASFNAHFERPNQVRRPSRRAVFSPPPPRQDNYIPPVPPLPPYARAEPPLRWRGPPDFHGLIRPLDQPLAFEQGLLAQRQLPPIQNPPQNPQAAAADPNAARRLNIGLGGALFAFNRRNRFEPAHPAPPPARLGAHGGGWRNIISDIGFGAYRMLFPDGSQEPPFMPGAEEDPDLLEALALDAEERHQAFRFRLHRRPFGNRHAAQQRHKAEPDYKPTFTHPAKPEPGFCVDFAPQEAIHVSDEAGASSSSGNETGTVLVCASCLDPLVMNVVASEVEMRERKLFALRCGHVLDGKCVDKIMKPPLLSAVDHIEDDQVNAPSLGKGKGKASIDDYTSTALSVGIEAIRPGDSGTTSVPIRLGKRKAEAPVASTAYTRSRLRPRTSENGLAMTNLVASLPYDIPLASDIPQESSLLDHVIPDSAARRRGQCRRPHGRGYVRGKGKRKGKGKAAAPRIEAVYEWSCPVAACGHKHKSVRINGVWRMDEDQGAIPMYV